MRSHPTVGGCVLRLALAELKPLASLRTTRLLALDRAGVARQEAEIAELPTVRLIDLEQRTRRRESKRARLARHAAALDLRLHVVTAKRVGRAEWLLDRGDERRAREVVPERAAVDFPLPRTRREVQAASGFLPAPDGVNHVLCHYSVSVYLRVSTVGCCATCGWSAFGYTRSLLRSTCRPSAVFGSMP